MSAIKVSQLSKAFGSQQVLREVSLELATSNFLAVLGPSGCGKTTLLRCLAGFERIDQGEIQIADKLVAATGFHLPAHLRQVVIVPQEGALFPHLNVAENVGFGLQKLSKQQRRDRVAQCLELVGLPGSQQRTPHELSGGMRQRVAVARALAPRPPLVLLDEPFSALDAGLRVGLRKDIRAALQADGTTGILVTHDQGEALSMADQVAVMHEGVIRQVGTPGEVYQRPADEWVAGFLGEANLFTLDSQTGTPIIGALSDAPTATRMVVRPEQLRLVAPHAGAATGIVESIDYHGHDVLLQVKLSDGALVSIRALGLPGLPQVGDQVGLELTPDAAPAAVSS